MIEKPLGAILNLVVDLMNKIRAKKYPGYDLVVAVIKPLLPACFLILTVRKNNSSHSFEG